MRLPTALGLVSAMALAIAGAGALADDHGRDSDDFHRVPTATPIKHVVVIFQENVSFDHYFGPIRTRRTSPARYRSRPGRRTPRVNSLVTPLDVNHGFRPLAGIDLLNNNPNSVPSNPVAPVPPVSNGGIANKNGARRIESVPAIAVTGPDRGIRATTKAPNRAHTTTARWMAFLPSSGPRVRRRPAIGSKALVMGYYDGNTVTALWNYASISH